MKRHKANKEKMSLHTKFTIQDLDEKQKRLLKIVEGRYSPKSYKTPSERVQEKIKNRISKLKGFNRSLEIRKSLSSIKTDEDEKHNVSVASTKVEYCNMAEFLKETHPLFHDQELSLCK